MMPSNVAARMTLAADPGSLHGAVAAGILGAGPVLLGTSEACAHLLDDAVRSGEEPAQLVERLRGAGENVPGFGHPVHRTVDPRAERIFELSDARGVSRVHVDFARRLRNELAPLTAERCDGDRRRIARPRVCGRCRQGCPDPGAHRRAPSPPCGGARAPDRISARTCCGRCGRGRVMLDPAVEARSWDEQTELDSASYAAQLDYLVERSRFYRAKLGAVGIDSGPPPEVSPRSPSFHSRIRTSCARPAAAAIHSGRNCALTRRSLSGSTRRAARPEHRATSRSPRTTSMPG